MKYLGVLEEFDKNSELKFDEFDVSKELNKLIPSNKEDTPFELKAEVMAFDFCEDYQTKPEGWGTYFGPMYVSRSKEGQVIESPSITLVNKEMIEYWEKRVDMCENPILKARYSGLVWDFTNIICKKKPDYNISKIYINSLIEISKQNKYSQEYQVYKKLERALELSNQLNYQDLVIASKDAIMNYEKVIGVVNHVGLWGFAFDLLLFKKNIKLDEAEIQEIISELEVKLDYFQKQVISGNASQIWAIESAVNRLSKYYHNNNDRENLKRVITVLSEGFQLLIKDSTAIQTSTYLEKLLSIFKQYKFPIDEKIILLKIRALGPSIAKELKPVAFEFSIPREYVENYLNSMTTGAFPEVIERFMAISIPRKEDVEKQLFELSKSNPLQFIFGRVIQDEKGRVLAKIGSLETDLDNHIIHQTSQNLQHNAPFLHLLIEKIVEKFNFDKNSALELIKKSAVIEEDRHNIILKCLDAYYEKDYLSFIHLAIPQIEEAFRNLLEFSGGVVLRHNTDGSFNLKTFNEILKDPIVIDSLGYDFVNYFRIIFTEHRAWNLRNKVCHGIAKTNDFNYQSADRVFHCLLCLGVIKDAV